MDTSRLAPAVIAALALHPHFLETSEGSVAAMEAVDGAPWWQRDMAHRAILKSANRLSAHSELLPLLEEAISSQPPALFRDLPMRIRHRILSWIEMPTGLKFLRALTVRLGPVWSAPIFDCLLENVRLVGNVQGLWLFTLAPPQHQKFLAAILAS